ncbi:SPOR domain-containing protein [Maricaulis sp.]|uniref:SPOR domain-containing protein n=1 Tax=Maricaulis sp. TaxID=1486257 RepID=UPI002622F500|nr:SPOR domain-containing protein [Maricaulis sp.]
MTRIGFALLLLPLAGCATLSSADTGDVEVSIAPTANARLADATARELAHLARFDPQQIETVEPELIALARALSERGDGPDPSAMPAASGQAAGAPAAPPADMIDAPSLQHGVHIASYRHAHNAVAGWQTLQSEHPGLGALEARLETREIAGRGTFLRLKAGPFDSAGEARSLCADIEARGGYCMAGDFTGQGLEGVSEEAHE